MKFHIVLSLLALTTCQAIIAGNYSLVIQDTFTEHKTKIIIGAACVTGLVGYGMWKYSSPSKKNSKKKKGSNAISFFSNNNFSSVSNNNTNSHSKQYQSQKSRKKALFKTEPINNPIPPLDYNNSDDCKVSIDQETVTVYESIVKKLYADKKNIDSEIYLEKLKKIYKHINHNFLDELINIVFDQQNEHSATHKKSFIKKYSQDLYKFEKTFTTVHFNNHNKIIQPIKSHLKTLKEHEKMNCCNYLFQELTTECNSINQGFLETVIQMIFNNTEANALEEFLDHADNEQDRNNLAKEIEMFKLECPVCYNLLDTTNRKNVCLNFHQICNQCLENLSKTEQKACPECRSPFDFDIINSKKS